MGLDYSNTTLFDGTPEMIEIKSENYKLIGLNSFLVLSLVIIGTIVLFRYTQEKDKKSLL